MSSAPEVFHLLRPTFAEIDLDAFRENVRTTQAALPAGTRIIAMIKANAYGHGAVAMARVCEEEEVAMLGVAILAEALELRSAGIRIPILILGPLMPRQVPLAVANDVVIAIVGPEIAHALFSWSAENPDARVRVHLKLDSGMGRLGLLESDLREVAEGLRAAPSIEVEAIYTHFANASNPADPYTDQQIENFERMLSVLRAFGVDAPKHHFSNSAAFARGLIAGSDFIRVGITLYGGEPLDYDSPRLRPVLRWTTRVARVKELPAGSPIGYGTTFVTARPSIIATLPVGYADGYDRLLSNNAEVLLRGRRVPVVGRVSMDLVTIDATDSGAEAGEEVVLIGRQGDEEVTAEELARKTGTIPYEVFCRISDRVPRVFLSAGRATLESRFAEHVAKGSAAS